MKLTQATFTFTNKGVAYQVTWRDDRIYIESGDRSHSIDNSKKEWKPCATHAQDLIRIHCHAQPQRPRLGSLALFPQGPQ